MAAKLTATDSDRKLMSVCKASPISAGSEDHCWLVRGRSPTLPRRQALLCAVGAGWASNGMAAGRAKARLHTHPVHLDIAHRRVAGRIVAHALAQGQVGVEMLRVRWGLLLRLARRTRRSRHCAEHHRAVAPTNVPRGVMTTAGPSCAVRARSSMAEDGTMQSSHRCLADVKYGRVGRD